MSTTTILNSIPGRVLRFAAGSAISLWGFSFAVPEGLVVQTLGVTMAVFALADVSVLRAIGVGGRAVKFANERHA